MAKSAGINRSTLYRWQYHRPLGTDGIVPNIAVERVTRAARICGIVLTPQDWIPERINYEPVCPDPRTGDIYE
jgi:hypothetical protein